MDFSNFDKTLEALVNSDLVEYVFNENAYYLAYNGFTVLEEFEKSNQSKEVIPQSKAEQYEEFVNSFGGEKRFKIAIISIIFILGISGSLLLYSNQNSIVIENSNSKFKIDEETIEEIETEIKETQDAVFNPNNSE